MEIHKTVDGLSKESLVRILKRIYETHEKDYEFYNGFKHGNQEHNKLLSGVFKTRIERID